VTYSLAIANGDLVRTGNSMAIVYGSEKLKQDLCLWVTERYGIDRFHPKLGSVLPDFIGSLITDNTRSKIQSEVLRILQNYQSVQLQGLKAAPQRYSYSELLYSIDAINVAISYDTVSATVSVRNADNAQATIAVSQGA
jgi:phage baseplate assembly protein W